MTTDEVIELYLKSGRKITVSESYDWEGIKSKYISHEKTTQTIFKFDVKKSILVYYDYFLKDLVEPNYYGDRFIVLPKKPGVTFDYSYCDEKTMMNLLDKRIQQYEIVLKQVMLKNKEWKMGKDFE